VCFATSAVFKASMVKKEFDATFLHSDFDNKIVAQNDDEELRMYHINGFTHTKIPVITNEQPHLVQGYNWGLIPKWAKDEKSAHDLRKLTLNAKSETIFEKPSFRDAAKTNHCIVLASGFFEWKTVGKDKIPHYIYCPEMPIMPLAGLYTTWKNNATQTSVNTVTILTTEANELMAEIHNDKKRMPVILPKHNIKKWFDADFSAPDAQQNAHNLLLPFDTNAMKAHEISKLITSRTHSSDVPEVLMPISTTLF
jgi:putative SOS response-associated peptidase YedK